MEVIDDEEDEDEIPTSFKLIFKLLFLELALELLLLLALFGPYDSSSLSRLESSSEVPLPPPVI